MRKELRITIAMALILMAVLMLVPGIMAAESKDVVSTLSLFRVITGVAGKEQLAPAEKVTPGDVVEYQVVFTNQSKAGVKNLQPTLPVPAEMEYLPNTTKPVRVFASVDGKTFEAVPLKRQVKKADGTIVTEEVPYAEYRYLRWSTSDLAAGGKVTLSARMKVTK